MLLRFNMGSSWSIPKQYGLVHETSGRKTECKNRYYHGNLQVPHTTQNWALLHIRPDNFRLFVGTSLCGYSFRRNDNRTLALWWNSMSDTGSINLFLRLLFAIEFESYSAKSLLQNCKISEHLSEDLRQKDVLISIMTGAVFSAFFVIPFGPQKFCFHAGKVNCFVCKSWDQNTLPIILVPYFILLVVTYPVMAFCYLKVFL